MREFSIAPGEKEWDCGKQEKKKKTRAKVSPVYRQAMQLFVWAKGEARSPSRINRESRYYGNPSQPFTRDTETPRLWEGREKKNNKPEGKYKNNTQRNRNRQADFWKKKNKKFLAKISCAPFE